MNLTDSKVAMVFINFETYFCKDYLHHYYFSKLRGRKGGGRDRMTADEFYSRHSDSIEALGLKCISGSYRFTPYNERLILKGKNKYPRIISVPAMKDRLILGVLNQYLQDMMPESVQRQPVNQIIRSVQNYRIKNTGKTIQFFKSDFSGFYDSINRNKLIEILENKGLDDRALTLIKSAINTPTIADKNDIVESTSEVGIPQGLAISNILSSTYLEQFDRLFREKASLYLRYVDDVLMLDYHDDEKELIDSIIRFNEYENLNLDLNPDKIKFGILGSDDVDFLGYGFYGEKTSIKSKNLTSFLNRIAKECTDLKNQYLNKMHRPLYLLDDSDFLETRINLLNLSIRGIKVAGKYYGWMHHYQQIDDVGTISMIDRIISKRLLSFLPKENIRKVIPLKRIYYAILSGKVRNVVFDYDNITSPQEMKIYLVKTGKLDPDKNYNDNEITELFIIHRERIKRRMEANIGIKS